MLSFEIKKFIKSKKFIFLIAFTFIITFYGLLFSKNLILDLKEYDYMSSSFNVVDNFFPDSNAPEELILKERQRNLSKNIIGNVNLSKKSQTKSEYEDNKWMLKLLENSKDKYPEIISEKNADRIGNLKWSIFKYERMLSDKSYDVYYRDNILGDNFAQKVILSSNCIFGVVPFTFFALLFSDIFSKEREKETLNLLYCQPINRRKFIISKYLLVAFSIVFYIIIVLIIYMVFSFVRGLPVNGFSDLYRILSDQNYLLYYSGFELILSTIFAFFSLTLFFSSFSLFLSSQLNSETVISIILVIIAILYAITPYFQILQSTLNPIYSLDIILRLLGDFSLKTHEQGMTSFKLVEHVEIIRYLAFASVAIILLFLSINVKIEKNKKQKTHKKLRSSTLFYLDIIKSLNTNSYKIFLLGVFIIITTIFVSQVRLNRNVEKETFGNFGMLKTSELSEIDFIKNNIRRWKDILSGKDYLNYYDTETESFVTKSKINDQDIELINSNIRESQLQIDRIMSKLNETDKLINAYYNKDGKNYYKYLKRYYNNKWKIFITSNREKSQSFVSSVELSNKIFTKASNNNIVPLTIVTPFYSSLDPFKDVKTNIEMSRNIEIYNHSGPLFLYKLLINNNLIAALIILIIVMVISGFTTDTESGNQIELMLMTPYSRTRIFNSKVLSQFILSALTIVFIFIFIFMLGFLADGIRGFNLPIANYLKNKFELIPLWLYILRVIIGILALTLLVTCSVTTLSIYAKRKLSLLTLTSLTIVILNIINYILPNSIKILNPITYLKIDMLADQSLIIFEKLSNTNYFIGIATILAWSIIIYLIGRNLFTNKKDII